MRSSTLAALRRKWVRAVAGLAVIPLLLGAAGSGSGAVTDIHAKRLEHLVRHDCGSCHGMTLKGGLGPALLPGRLATRDEDALVQMILYGNPARAMPPWRHLLSEVEARWIARRLKQGFGAEEIKP